MHLSLRWLQIAKKMLAKSKKEGGGDSSTRSSNTNGRRPLPHPASGQSLATVSQTFESRESDNSVVCSFSHDDDSFLLDCNIVLVLF